MKLLILILLGSLTVTLSASGAEGRHLFILSGQSNMAGLDEKLTFVPAVTNEFGKDNVVVVKDAMGGQPIWRWYKKWKPKDQEWSKANGDLYDRLMTKVNAAIKDKPIASVTFVWMQGESDAANKWGEVYAASLQGLIDQLQDDLKRKDVNVVIGRISDYDMTDKRYAHWTMVRKALVEVAESNKRYAWVDTDDLNGAKNDLHYDADGYKTLGTRFAEKAIELIKGKAAPNGAGAKK
jgi:hypothetical protein